MAILPLPPSGVAFIDPITGGVSVQWQNYLLSLSTIGGIFAPIDARYWVSTPDASLTNETNIGALATGYLKITTAAGVATPATVTSIPGTDITGAALTKTDDTNVTLTLGGSAATALLRAASLTLGWTGTLSVPRGGSGAGTFTAHGVLLGEGTSAFGVTGTGTAGQVLTSNGALADPTFQSASSGTVTSVAQTVPGGFSISGSPVTTTGTLAISANGTSGGVLAYTGATTMASSGALTQHGVVIGGGAGAVPVSTSAGTAGQALRSNGASADPTFQAETYALLTQNSGSTSTTSATNLDTLALSGLTQKDILVIEYELQQSVANSSGFSFYSSTDSTTIIQISGGVPSGNFFTGTVKIFSDSTTTTQYDAFALGAYSGGTNNSNMATPTLATAFTASWTLAFRSLGMVAGGTAFWRWNVYKLAGQ